MIFNNLELFYYFFVPLGQSSRIVPGSVLRGRLTFPLSNLQYNNYVFHVAFKFKKFAYN